MQALPTFNFDLTNPVIRAGLAPVVMNLEARGLTPETVSVRDLESAVAQAKVMVSAETQTLLKLAASMKLGQNDLTGVVTKLSMLQEVLGVYLPMEVRNSVQLAHNQAHSRLHDAQREKIDKLLRRTAGGLGGKTIVEVLVAENGVQEGAMVLESFARRHAVLAKPEPRAPKDQIVGRVGDDATMQGVTNLERKFLTLWEERESAGLPPFKNIVIDVRGSRGGRGDVAAGYLVAMDILARATRAREVPGQFFQITFIMDGKSRRILGGMRGAPVFPGQTDFEGRLAYHTLGSLPDDFPVADLYLALASPSGKVYFEGNLGYEEHGGIESGEIPVNNKTVILVQTVLGNTETNSFANPFALVQVAKRRLSLLPAGLGANESGVYSDQVAWNLRGKSRSQIRQFIIDSLSLVGDQRVGDTIKGILEGTLLSGSETGLVYGISSQAQKRQFESYLSGLAASAQISGKSYTLISPLEYTKENVRDEVLRERIEIILPTQVPDTPQAEPGKIYIVRTDGLPHPVFVGLMAYSRPPPVVAGDGAMSAAIILGRPFVIDSRITNGYPF